MSNAPERIWLQWEDHAGENTWCADQINAEDVEYLRADLHAAEVEALRKENERLTEVVDVAQEATKFARLDRDMYKTEFARLRKENERLRDALRLIELFGYRENEDFGWINAHMRGTATSALEGQDLTFYWRLFPNHRPRAALQGETE